MGQGPITASPSVAASLKALDGVKAKASVWSGIGNLWRFYAESAEASSTTYLQLFDAAAVGDVTLGTTAPTIQFELLAGQRLILDPNDFPILCTLKGLIVAVTTTRSGATTATNGANLIAWYKK